MKRILRVLIWVSAVGLVACGGVGEYRKTGGTYAPRGPACEYRVIRNRIVEPYEELGGTIARVEADAAEKPRGPIHRQSNARLHANRLEAI
jgi:hypothetical protein